MIFDIEVKNKIASYTGTDMIVCGNSDYKIKFSFDEEWGECQAKRARFSYVRKGREVAVAITVAGLSVAVFLILDVHTVEYHGHVSVFPLVVESLYLRKDILAHLVGSHDKDCHVYKLRDDACICYYVDRRTVEDDVVIFLPHAFQQAS